MERTAVETELKLDFAREDAAALAGSAILQAGGAAGERRLVSTYFDTADEALRRAGVTLRVREDGDRHIQTVKAAGAAAAGLFVRPEWERQIEGPSPVIDAAAGPLAGLVADAALVPRFVTDVRRVERTIDWEGARIEVAVDTGEVRAGDAVQPLAELELELRDGPVGALFDLARALDQVAPLRLGVRSKSERGGRLADGAAAAAVKAEPIRLDPEDDAVHAFAAIAHACLRQFRSNETILLTLDGGAAPLHQARVGLRRLRSAVSLFKPILEGDERLPGFAAALRELAGALGQVRDIDVLMERHDGLVGERLAAARADAFAAARARLEAPDTRRLMLDLAEWLAIGDWRTRPADPTLAHRPVVPFAADLLDRRRKRLKRRGRHLARIDDHRRHQVRIDGKKLRYAAEFFHGLWTGKKARRRHKAFADAIEALQEELGHLNDAAAGAAVLARLGIEAGHAGAAETPHALARAEAAFETLMEVKRFWR